MNYHILGQGGFARELKASLQYQHRKEKRGDNANFYFYEDDKHQTAVDKLVLAFANGLRGEIHMGVGSPYLKKKWDKELEEKFVTQNFVPRGSYAYVFPGHYAGNVLDRDECDLAYDGIILCRGSVITTNVKLGQFVTINLNCTVGHDSTIGDFSTLAPGCNIAGNVHIGKSCNIGQNVAIIPGVELPDGGIIGANSVVLKTPNVQEIWDNCDEKHTTPFKAAHNYVMVGNPARVIKINGIRIKEDWI